MTKRVSVNTNALGTRVRDLTTSMTGVVTSISLDLAGCIQYLVQPGATDGEAPPARWVDAKFCADMGRVIPPPGTGMPMPDGVPLEQAVAGPTNKPTTARKPV